VPHELDVHYKSLNCALSLVDPKSKEYEMISKYTAATSSPPYFGWITQPKIIDVWRVDRDKVVSVWRSYKQ